jgi:hypothetical protein
VLALATLGDATKPGACFIKLFTAAIYGFPAPFIFVSIHPSSKVAKATAILVAITGIFDINFDLGNKRL